MFTHTPATDTNTYLLSISYVCCACVCVNKRVKYLFPKQSVQVFSMCVCCERAPIRIVFAVQIITLFQELVGISSIHCERAHPKNPINRLNTFVRARHTYKMLIINARVQSDRPVCVLVWRWICGTKFSKELPHDDHKIIVARNLRYAP